MPYEVKQGVPGCAGYAVVKTSDQTIMGCHETKEDADKQLIAINIAEYGEASRALPNELVEGDFVEWMMGGERFVGRIEHVMKDGVLGVAGSDFSIEASPEDPAGLIRIFRETDSGFEETENLVGMRFSKLTKIEPLEDTRQVDLTPPSFMRSAARRGLEFYEQGLAGDGLRPATVREARQMARGEALSLDKWKRLGAWVARHRVDWEGVPQNSDASNEDFPGPGAVAAFLWGVNPTNPRSADQVINVAERKVATAEAEAMRDLSEDYEWTDVQRSLYAAFEVITDEYGQFNQSTDGNGAHYFANNPFAEQGMKCANCAFYRGPQACEIVSGVIAPQGLCKFWIIPASLIQSERQTGASTPAPPEDQITGSQTNRPGSAAGASGGIEISEATETGLRNRATEHNEAMERDNRPEWTRVSLGQLRSVYRRGAGAYSVSHRPGTTRAQWAFARVRAYLFLARTGRPQNPNYTTDNDLLHPDHPRSTRRRSYDPND